MPYLVTVYGLYWANHWVARFRGRQVEDVPGGFLQVGQGGLAAQQHGAGVDLVHEVEALEFDVLTPVNLIAPALLTSASMPPKCWLAWASA